MIVPVPIHLKCPHYGEREHIWVSREGLDAHNKAACDIDSSRTDGCYYKMIKPDGPDNPCSVDDMMEISS